MELHASGAGASHSSRWRSKYFLNLRYDILLLASSAVKILRRSITLLAGLLYTYFRFRRVQNGRKDAMRGSIEADLVLETDLGIVRVIEV